MILNKSTPRYAVLVLLSFVFLWFAPDGLVLTAAGQKTPAPAVPSSASPEAANSFETKLTAFKAANKDTINRALISYLNRLGTLRKTIAQRGDLDAVLAVKAEEERVGTAQRVTAADIVAKPPELNALMKAFVQGMAAHNANQQTRFKALIDQERASLQQEISLLTKADKIDAAIAKKEELAAFDAKLRQIFVAAVKAKRATTNSAATNPGTEGLRVDEEGRVDLTMGRDAADGGGKTANRPFKAGKLLGKPEKADKPEKTGKRWFFER